MLVAPSPPSGSASGRARGDLVHGVTSDGVFCMMLAANSAQVRSLKYQTAHPHARYVKTGMMTKVVTTADRDGWISSPSEVVFRTGRAQNACRCLLSTALATN